jgi:hypothetical protein
MQPAWGSFGAFDFSARVTKSPLKRTERVLVRLKAQALAVKPKAAHRLFVHRVSR